MILFSLEIKNVEIKKSIHILLPGKDKKKNKTENKPPCIANIGQGIPNEAWKILFGKKIQC